MNIGVVKIIILINNKHMKIKLFKKILSRIMILGILFMSGIKNVFAGNLEGQTAGKPMVMMGNPIMIERSFWSLDMISLIVFAPILIIGLLFYGVYFYGVIKKKKNKRLFEIGSWIIIIDIIAYIIYRIFDFYDLWSTLNI